MSRPDPRPWPETFRISTLALVPLVVHWALRVVVAPRPYWAYFFDPETMYFYSSLEILSGTAPTDVDNPGTPVQMLGALIALFTGRSPLSVQTFLVVGYCLALLATIGGVLLLVRRVFPRLSEPAVLGAIWLSFLCPQALARNAIWGVEPFQFGAGALALWALVVAFEKPEATRRWLLAGAATGLLCALKFTFLAWGPALAAGLVWASRRDPRALARRIGAAAGGAVAGFLLGTAAAWTRLPAMAARVLDLARQGGRPPWEADEASLSYLDGLLLPLRSGTTWFALVGAVAVGTVLALRRSDDEERALPGGGGLTVFALATLVTTHLAAAREPYLRYFLPTAPAAVLLAAVGLGALPARLARRVSGSFVVVVGLLLVRQVWMDVGWHVQISSEHRFLRADAERAISDAELASGAAGESRPVVLYGGRFPDPGFALLLFARTDGQRAEVGSAHPFSGQFDRRSGRVRLPPGARHWDYLVLEEHDLAVFPQPVGPVIATVGADYPTTPVYHVLARP